MCKTSNSQHVTGNRRFIPPHLEVRSCYLCTANPVAVTNELRIQEHAAKSVTTQKSDAQLWTHFSITSKFKQ